MNIQPFHDWRGSAHEIGRMHGAALARQIAAECQPALDAAAANHGRDVSHFLARYLERYEPMFRALAPRAIDEIRGIAAGSGLDYPRAFFAATRDGAKLPDPSDEACTAFHCPASTTSDGHVLIGQTKDTNAPIERYHVMRRAYDDGLVVLTLNYPGWIANIGVNSHGVGWTGNALYARAAETDTVPFSLTRFLIAESRRVDQVVRRIDEMPMENGCMMLADAAHHAVCLEFAAGQYDCRDIADEAFGHANSILCPRLQPHEDIPRRSASSPARQHLIQAALDAASGRLSIATLQSILADHTHPSHSLCLHGCGGETISTTAAMIVDCTARTAAIRIGRPCSGPFTCYPAYL